MGYTPACLGAPEPAHHATAHAARSRSGPQEPASRHVRRPLRAPSPDARLAHRSRPDQRSRRRDGDARGAPRPARSGRQLQGRQGLHGPRARACHRRRGPGLAERRPAGRQDRQRGADRAPVGGRPDAPPGGQPGRHRAGRPAGFGQDDDGREACPPHRQDRAATPPGGRRPVPPGRHRAADDAWREPRHPGLRGARRDAGAGDRSAGDRARPPRGPRHGDPGHGRPPDPRRGPDGRGDRARAGGPAGRDAPRGRRDGRPGGGRGGPGVRRRRPADRPRADEDRRGCARRRGALDQRGLRAAGEVPRHRREDRRPRTVPPGPPRRTDPRHGRRPDPDRAGPGCVRRHDGREGRGEAADGQLHPGGHARAAPAGQEDGAARPGHGDDSGPWRDGPRGAGFGRSRRPRGGPRRSSDR